MSASRTAMYVLRDRVCRADGTVEVRNNTWLAKWGRPSARALRTMVMRYELAHPGENILAADVVAFNDAAAIKATYSGTGP